MSSKQSAAEQLCWTSLRSFMTAYAEHKVREFAAQHAEETFYCLGVYFDDDYADFFLYLNDLETAHETAKQYDDGSRAADAAKRMAEQSKWYLDSFRYQIFNVDPLWEKLWYPVQTLFQQLASELPEADESQESLTQWCTTFGETACLVALDLERSEAVRELKRTEDFRVICVDHDESLEVSFARLEHVRQKYEPLPSP